MQRFHYIQNATGFYGRAVAVLSREGARFPDTSIRPKLLETAAATVRGWVGGAEPDPAEAFDARFGVECADAAFLQRFLTRELKQLLLQDRTCSLQLANDTVAVGPATEHPYKTRIPVADYERALLLARTGMEAARRAGGPAEEPDARR
jgi:hypothetical protein